ncbi:AMP-dependent synthetase and ligase [Natrinema versiforme JCM 10478]|uniref:AMP-dependent synthetase and ligase n=1 Tax=Natrinema versiforme JCM 10478 TaxID=1227496 RepID=L9XRQ6_9EURY|nr:AMP-dependent synthetase and ligase [Natrinema versiforme JCM 10478]
MTAPIQDGVRETFVPEIFVNHYGSTEVDTHSICSWIDSKPGSAGRTGINTRIRIVDSKRDGTVPPSETVERANSAK